MHTYSQLTFIHKQKNRPSGRFAALIIQGKVNYYNPILANSFLTSLAESGT